MAIFIDFKILHHYLLNRTDRDDNIFSIRKPQKFLEKYKKKHLSVPKKNYLISIFENI